MQDMGTSRHYSRFPITEAIIDFQRRLFLINKQFHSPEGLSAAKGEELQRLQAAFESYLDSNRPLPNQMLEELEALAEQLEAEDQRS
jgi:hypothetical protein